MFIPRKNWLKLSITNVGIFDGFWGFAWKEWAKIEKVGEFYKVKLAMNTKAIYGVEEIFMWFLVQHQL